MSLRFVVGPPGSGKTAWCIEQVRRAALKEPVGPPLILLVPEQASYQTEQLLLSGELAGTVRARVFSFQRLAHWVWSLSPGPQRPHLNDLHRRVLVTAILAKMRAEGKDLAVAKVRNIDRCVGDMVSELKLFRVTAQSLAELSNRFTEADPGLARKLSEIAAVAAEYDERVTGRFMDPETSLASLREAASSLEVLQGARVFADGFHGFTPVEMEVLRGLTERVAKLNVTLTMNGWRFAELREGSEPDEWSRSLPTEETAKELLALAADAGVETGDVIELPSEQDEVRFRKAALRWVCEGFRSESAVSTDSDGSGLEFVECESVKDEVRTAGEMLLAWRAQGWNWGEMAVVARSMDTYGLEVENLFAAFGIPCFLDRHEPLETHPAIQGTIAAVEAAMMGLTTERILEFATSRLFEFDPDDVARLQEFVEEFPRRSRDWTDRESWSQPPSRSAFEEEDFAAAQEAVQSRTVDVTRRAVVEPLRRLEISLHASQTGEGWTMGGFLRPVCELLRLALLKPSEEDAKVLARVGELFEAMGVAAGEEVFEREVLLDLLRESLGELELPRIPPRVDQVIVGQVDRTRFPDVRGAVVLGLAEGEFPPPGSNSSLLTDREREQVEALAGRTVRFRPSSRQLFQREAFHAWIAFTRASEGLVLTRPLTFAGESLNASPWWEDVRRLFPRIKPRLDAETDEAEKVVCAREAAAVVCRSVFETRGRDMAPPPQVPWTSVLEPLSREQRSEFLSVVRGAGLRNRAELDPGLARQFTPDIFQTSVSAIQAHRQCAFQYFMSRMIEPRVAIAPRVSPADVGNLAHATLKDLTERFIRRDQAFHDVTDEELRAEVLACFETPYRRLATAGLFENPSADNMALMIREHVCDVANYLAALQRRLKSTPRFAEISFGSGQGAGRVETQAGDVTVRLRGQIDHVTAGVDRDGREWLFVIDFKLTQRKQNWAAALDGSNLQLPVYLFALSALPTERQAKPGGAFFLQIVSKEEEQRRLFGIAPAGAVNTFDLGGGADGEKFVVSGPKPHEKTAAWGDVISDRQFDELFRKTEASIVQRVREILSGNVEVKPALIGKSTPCSWCEYRKACRLDYTMNTRRLVPVTKRADAIEQWLGPAS